MNILFITPEMLPYAKTGGLADVCGSLPWTLVQLGLQVRSIMPLYKAIDRQRFKMKLIIKDLAVSLGGETIKANIFSHEPFPEHLVYFVECERFFARSELYTTKEGDYPDNDLRFIFFQRVSLEFFKRIGLKPDIIHCHDWQTALVPVYLKTLYRNDPFYSRTRSILTIHNLAYQGLFPKEHFPLTGLDWSEYNIEGLEFWGNVNFLKGGIIYSHALTTVSPHYAQEIQTPEFGCGLDGVLKKRQKDLYGIINGLDYHYWNPKTDRELKARYSVKSIWKKRINKSALQQEQGLEEDPEIFLIGMITRLADQKGLDITLKALKGLMEEKIQLVILGTGDERYHRLFQELSKKYPGKIGINLKFDAPLSKRIYAGSDAFLMPSRYEPCGLGQLISLRYGTVPIVRATGGLIDTVSDFDPATGKGNGIVFREYSSQALLKAVERALYFYSQKRLWRNLVKTGMREDFSWTNSARHYLTLYQKYLKVEEVHSKSIVNSQ